MSAWEGNRDKHYAGKRPNSCASMTSSPSGAATQKAGDEVQSFNTDGRMNDSEQRITARSPNSGEHREWLSMNIGTGKSCHAIDAKLRKRFPPEPAHLTTFICPRVTPIDGLQLVGTGAAQIRFASRSRSGSKLACGNGIRALKGQMGALQLDVHLVRTRATETVKRSTRVSCRSCPTNDSL